MTEVPGTRRGRRCGYGRASPALIGLQRTAEGKTKPEIMRCLKRYLTREVYRLLVPMPG